MIILKNKGFFCWSYLHANHYFILFLRLLSLPFFYFFLFFLLSPSLILWSNFAWSSSLSLRTAFFHEQGRVLKTSLQIHRHLTHFQATLILRDSIHKGGNYNWKEKFPLVTSRGNGPLKGQSWDSESLSNPAKRLIGKIKIEIYNYSYFISSLGKYKSRQDLHNPDSQVYITLSDLHDLKNMAALIVKLSE